MDAMIMYDKGRRDLRLVTVRRGGTLEDADHRLLAGSGSSSCSGTFTSFSQVMIMARILNQLLPAMLPSPQRAFPPRQQAVDPPARHVRLDTSACARQFLPRTVRFRSALKANA